MTEEIGLVTLGVMIAKRERCPGKNEGILSGIVSVKQMESRLRKMRFANIWDWSFSMRKLQKKRALPVHGRGETTIIGFVTGVVIMAVHPLRVMLFMEKCFERRKMYGIEIVLLEYITQMWEGNQRMLCKLAELYERMQGEESAVRLRKELVDYKGECGEREQIYLLQEKLWHLRYGDQEAVEELLNRWGKQTEERNFFFDCLNKRSHGHQSSMCLWQMHGLLLEGIISGRGCWKLEIGRQMGKCKKILQNLKNREKDG